MRLLGGLSPQRFLERHWQKQHLLVRAALMPPVCPLSADELFALAGNPQVESRLVIEKAAESAWQVLHGPFSKAERDTLPETHWSLLVQDVDKHHPDVARILAQFDFLPRWRIDDVMISYAPAQGSVGPHRDDYDVFLLQMQGQRRWQIADTPADEDELVPDADLRVLTSMPVQHEWILSPGDLLYLPPGVAHHGVALGPCETWSIGFRAPATAELLAALAEELLGQAQGKQRFEDPDRQVTPHCGEISPQDLHALRALLTDAVSQAPDRLDRWLGRYMSEPKPGLEPADITSPLSLPQLRDAWTLATTISHHPRTRWHYLQAADGRWYLYVDGREWPVSNDLQPLLQQLTAQPTSSRESLQTWLDHPDAATLLLSLVNKGYLLLSHD